MMNVCSAVQPHRMAVQSGVMLLLLATAQAGTGSAPIAFAAHVGGNWDLFSAEPDGANLVQLTNTPFDENEPCWSPDRKRIAYSASDGRIYLLDVATGESRELAADDPAKKKTSPSFSPDGTQVVYVRFTNMAADDTELAICDLEDGSWRSLIDQPGPQFDPAWSPDGKYVAYTTVHCTAQCGRIIQELWLAAVAGNYARQILLTNSHCMRPRWSPDGRRIAFCSDKGGNFDIWTVSLDDWSLDQVTTDTGLDTGPTWSPDGHYLGFVSTRSGGMRLWRKDLQTGREHVSSITGERDLDVRDIAW